MEKKYKLTEETLKIYGHVLHRIMALRDFGDVRKGDIGGWVENEDNLSHDDDCWVYNNVRVYEEARVYGVAEVYGEARVYGNAQVCGNAVIKKMSDYIVFRNWWSSGRHFTWTRSNDMWSAGCFYGTGEELIEKAYADSEEKGREYERIVKYVESIKSEINKQ